MIEAIYFRRCVTPRHLAVEFFTDGPEGKNNKIAEILARRRLKAYYRNYITDRFFVDPGPFKGTSPQHVVLDIIGAYILAGRWGVPVRDLKWRSDSKRVEVKYLEHIIGVNNFRAWLVETAREKGHIPGVWKVEHHNYVGFTWAGKEWRLEPDAYGSYGFSKGRGIHFYLEFDRTMAAGQWQDKLERYEAHYASNEWDRRRTYPAVLCVTYSWKRAEDLLGMAESQDVPWLFSSYEDGFVDRWIGKSGEIKLFA